MSRAKRLIFGAIAIGGALLLCGGALSALAQMGQ